MLILNRKSIPKTKINSLLIDGEALLKQGFHGTKDIQMKNGSVGAISHFINTIKRFYQDQSITKVIVFWEGENSRVYRQRYYPYYKQNRNDRYSEDQIYDLGRQRMRIKQYLEELFIRQVEIPGCEADDGIAYYVKNSPNEKKLIYTNDSDLLQLLADDVKVYLYGKKVVVNKDNFQNYFKYHYTNVGLLKMIAGDTADNISGIQNIGEETVLKLFPALKKETKTYEWILEETDRLLLEKPTSNQLQTIKEGVTKWGTYGVDYFSVMNKIINLDQPNVTDEMKIIISEMVNEPLCPEGRGGVKQVIEMMKQDEIINFIPKSDDAYFIFWSTFITIIKKETNLYNKTR